MSLFAPERGRDEVALFLPSSDVLNLLNLAHITREDQKNVNSCPMSRCYHLKLFHFAYSTDFGTLDEAMIYTAI